MDKDFDKNFVKPNDPGFVYDKVVDFNQDGASDSYTDGWDD